MLSFGQRLKIIRKDTDLSQSDIAEKIGVSVQSVSKWECDNAMPDISQIVPLASVLNVTTDCLLGVGRDEEGDRKKLDERIKEITENYTNGSEENNGFYMSYEAYKDFLRMYPLNNEIKLKCADCAYRYLFGSLDRHYYEIQESKVNEVYEDALKLLRCISNTDKNIANLLTARCYLVYLKVLKKDYEGAEADIALVPEEYGMRNSLLLNIAASKGDFEGALKIAEDLCKLTGNGYIVILFIRARRISIFGNVRKKEAIEAWSMTEKNARLYYSVNPCKDSAEYVILANSYKAFDYFAIDETDKVYECFSDYVSFVEEMAMSEEKQNIFNDLKENIVGKESPYFDFIYNYGEKPLANEPRYIKLIERLEALKS